MSAYKYLASKTFKRKGKSLEIILYYIRRKSCTTLLAWIIHFWKHPAYNKGNWHIRLLGLELAITYRGGFTKAQREFMKKTGLDKAFGFEQEAQ